MFYLSQGQRWVTVHRCCCHNETCLLYLMVDCVKWLPLWSPLLCCSLPSLLISLLISFLVSYNLSPFHSTSFITPPPLHFLPLFLCFLACSLVWQESAVNRGERRRDSPGSIMGTSMVHMVHKHISAATLQKRKTKAAFFFFFFLHILCKAVIIMTDTCMGYTLGWETSGSTLPSMCAQCTVHCGYLSVFLSSVLASHFALLHHLRGSYS